MLLSCFCNFGVVLHLYHLWGDVIAEAAFSPYVT